MERLNIRPGVSRLALPKVLRLGTLWLAGLLIGPLAQGFESHEHREMSDLAVKVALAMARAEGQVPPPAIGALQMFDAYPDPLASVKFKGKPIYGRITECVDFFMFPEKILAYGWKVTLTSLDAVRPPSAPGGVPTDDHPVWRELLEKCDRQSVAAIQASHSNHSHFQQDLLMALRMWHLSAVAMAQQEKNFYGGLLINAIADHYLQDFFAPGHQVTPRDRLTDVPATATHDLANERGALFRPYVPGKWPAPAKARPEPKGAPKWLQVLSFLCNNRPYDVSVDAKCEPTPEIVALLNSPERRHINIDDLPIHAQALWQGRPVFLRGDGLLGGKEQARQRVLMLAVQVSSILDVLEGKNELNRFDFFYDMKTGQPYATANFGEYDFRVHDQPIEAAMSQPAPAPAEPPTGGAYYLTVPMAACSSVDCDGRLYKLRTRALSLGLSLQRESHADGAYHARSLLTAEVSAGGLVWNSGKFFGGRVDTVELVPVFGYAYYKEDGFRGNGPTFRLSMAVPETEFSLSGYLRWLNYPEADKSARRLSYGIRADAGFSSYFTFFVGVGMDYAVTAAGTLTQGLIVSSGIRVGAPMTRLKLQ